LQFARSCLDSLAADVSETQVQRRRENRKKRKRSEKENDDMMGQPLQLRKVHVDGFAIGQIWEQAKRVLDASSAEAEAGVRLVEQELAGTISGSADQQTLHGVAKGEAVHSGMDRDDFSNEPSLEEDTGAMEDALEDGEDAESIMDGADQELGINDEDLDEGEDVEEEDIEDDLSGEEEPEDEHPNQEFVADPNGLNDGFFSIDDFNKQSEFLEQVDARGDLDDGAASDEEEVDWELDPLSADPRSGAKITNGADDDEMDDETGAEDEEEGPTFGNADLNAPEGASEDEADHDMGDEDMEGLSGGLTNTNNIMYQNFFAPPPQKRVNRKGRPHPHNFPSKTPNTLFQEDDRADDVDRTISVVHRDIFSESPEPDSDAAAEPRADPSDPRSRRSTHEKRQSRLAEEIRRLEAANVTKRNWTLQGEARANDRPVNSLLEEDLDFERAGKPVQPVTQEVTEDIEALVKRRILAKEFDEVTRRRPDSLAPEALRRGKAEFEIEDTKSGKGLAEVYEEEHLKRTDPNYVDARDERLEKEYKEIEGLWRDVEARLDALSSWHYKPKPPQMQVEVRVDAPVVSLEDARPTVGSEVGGSLLAPQEVYRAGEEKGKGEVATKGGQILSREELTKDEKVRRRRREKERLRKAGVQGDGSKKSAKQQEKSNVVGDLKKGGVKVIGKKGRVTDVEGKEVKQGGGRNSAGAFKL